jgi:hypothetical protein
MLEQESEEVKSRIKQEAAEEHEALLEAHLNRAEGFPSADEEEREMYAMSLFICADEIDKQYRAQERFSSVVTPLLVAIREYTGYTLTLLAGRVQRGVPLDEVQVLGYVLLCVALFVPGTAC